MEFYRDDLKRRGFVVKQRECVTVKVPNMKQALAFCTKVLDFELTKEDGPKIVSLVHENIPIVLEEKAVQTDSKNVLLGIPSSSILQDHFDPSALAIVEYS
ncbi:hypothetical protein [Anaerobacillus sp. 1_MG-2023]|uniref:hypothetical protein n=1 Tax=Bacillales TaxID=1385 RepID=UPI0026E27D9C|nr:hypothetical protein [Anaerobacillus sp. 1_MG-2023]MDO6655849.1 hypothetical protein [Anaerobacillus sp. 1_MG-2023]